MVKKARTLWSDEEIETLRTEIRAGRTAKEISAMLNGKSREAVLGKVHRMNLGGERPARPTGTKQHKPKKQTQSLKPPQKMVEQAPPENTIPFFNLGPGQCRWVYGPSSAAAPCCGLPSVPGLSWCKSHLSNVYQQKPRKFNEELYAKAL